MELTIEPELYMPSIDSLGNYVDKIPSCKNGLTCPCGSRKEQSYTKSSFSLHIKTKTHQKWLSNLNLNKSNHYIECVKLTDLVENQRLIIAERERRLAEKDATIAYLTKQLNKEQDVATANLLD